MNWYLVLLTFWAIFLMTNVKVVIQLKKKEGNDLARLELQYFFGLIKLKFNIPVMKLQSLYKGVEVKGKLTTDMAQEPNVSRGGFFLTPRKVKHFFEFLNRIRERIRDMSEIAKRTLKYVRCEKWEWYTAVGTGDAALTGTVTGLLWGVKGSLLGVASQYINLQTKPSFQVVPTYQQQTLNVNFLFVFRLRIIHSLIAIWTIVSRLIRSQLRMRFGLF